MDRSFIVFIYNAQIIRASTQGGIKPTTFFLKQGDSYDTYNTSSHQNESKAQ